MSIGERRKPDPRGRPGYLRVAVHQGDTETHQGLYHINAVDTVTPGRGLLRDGKDVQNALSIDSCDCRTGRKQPAYNALRAEAS